MLVWLTSVWRRLTRFWRASDLVSQLVQRASGAGCPLCTIEGLSACRQLSHLDLSHCSRCAPLQITCSFSMSLLGVKFAACSALGMLWSTNDSHSPASKLPKRSSNRFLGTNPPRGGRCSTILGINNDNWARSTEANSTKASGFIEVGPIRLGPIRLGPIRLRPIRLGPMGPFFDLGQKKIS